MKKILLSCVTCLLALGLVTACNNEEEDVNGSDGDTTSQDTGTSGGTTEGGGTTEAVTLTNYTVSFSFVDEDGEATTLEEGATLYIIGDWDSWVNFLPCTEVDGVYSYTFATITTGTYEYKGVTYDGEDAVTWNNCTEVILDEDGKSNAKLVVSESDEGGQTITIGPASSSSSTVIEEGTHFYVAFIDNSVDTWETAEPVESLEGNFYFEASAYTGEEGETYTRVNNPNIWSGANYCDATQTTSTDGHVILYSEEAIAIPEDELWIDVNNGEHWMSQGSSPVEIPADDNETYVCVIPAWFYGWLDDEEYPSWSGASINWHTLEAGQTIADFVSSLTLETATVSEGE